MIRREATEGLRRAQGRRYGHRRQGRLAQLDDAGRPILSDIKMPVMNGLSFESARLKALDTHVIMMTAFGVEDAVTAMKKGAYDYVQGFGRSDRN